MTGTLVPIVFGIHLKKIMEKGNFLPGNKAWGGADKEIILLVERSFVIRLHTISIFII